MPADRPTKLPVKNRRQDEGKLFLVKKDPTTCQHRGSFEIDRDGDICTCQDCGQTVSAMFVLDRLRSQESLWARSLENYKDAMQRLSKKKRCKCQHCGKITKILRY